MEVLPVLAVLLFLASLLISVIVAAKFKDLKLALEELKRRVLELEGRSAPRVSEPTSVKPVKPPPLPAFLQPPVVPPATGEPRAAISGPSPTPAINWESVLGVKLFAWIGGLAFFLGVVFFIKYAFENNWITPVMRIVAGAIVGTALILVSVFPGVRRYRVPAQSLCATGVLILYANIYAAYAFYDLIALSAASVLMWIVTAGALVLASRLDTQSVAWLAVLGGYLTPALLWTRRDNPAALFGYIAVLNFGIAAVCALKRWSYLILLAAIGSVIMEFSWAADFFGPASADTARIVFLAIQAQFLLVCILFWRTTKSEDYWGLSAAAIAGFATLLFCMIISVSQRRYDAEIVFPLLFLGNVGLIALAVAARAWPHDPRSLAALVGAALVLTWLAEWGWHNPMLGSDQPHAVLGWYVAIFLLFAVTPYFCGANRVWPWMISAIAGPLQFWLVYQLAVTHFVIEWKGLLPLAFAVPAAAGIIFLVKKEGVSLASADVRLASQGAALLAFISLVFPVQFEHEWITIGWAIEGLALILLFRWIPNPRLRAVALILFCAAFVRLALNPAVLEYHPRTRSPVFNWYLYAYGVPAICFFLAARWFGEPRMKPYERHAPTVLYTLGSILCFLLLNIEIADYFSIGPTLTFSFSGNFARDMTYTVAWAICAFVSLVIGIARNIRPLRFVAIGLLSLALLKLFLHDLDSLNQLYRIAAFITVAIIAIVASFIYQRFLSPGLNKS